MNIGKFVLLTATLMLAMAFTLSCSSGDDDESGGSGADMSGLPTQLFLGGEAYTGNGDVVLVLGSDTLPAGKIQNGKLALNLPQNLASKYLVADEPCHPEDDRDCDASNYSYTKDVAYYYIETLTVITPEEMVKIRLRTGTGEHTVKLYYFSKSGYMKGTIKYEEETATYDVNFSKGWNIIYYHYSDDLMTTNIPQEIKDMLKWTRN